MSKIVEALKEQDGDCIFLKLLSKLDEEDLNAILEAIRNGKSGYAISEALHAGGYRIAHSTVSRHVRKVCKCYGEN